jgi:excisionase family DNA binding protein
MTDRLTEPKLTLSRAAKLLGVSPSTLHRWAESGQVGFYLTPSGSRLFGSESHLRPFLERAEVPARNGGAR